MEFSFDRSKNVNTNQQDQANAQTGASQQSASSTSSRDEVDTSQIANERLRKAIERNRARQKERDTQSPQAFNRPQANETAPANNSAWSQHQASAGISNPREEMSNHHQSSLFEKQREAQREMHKEVPPELPKEAVRESVREAARESIREAQPEVAKEIPREPQREVPREAPRSINRTMSRPSMSERAASLNTQYTSNTVDEAQKVDDGVEQVASRRTVARPNDTEFAPVRRTSKRAATQISYTTGQKKKAKELDQKYIDYLVKGSWLFCGFLILRLIFANGGVVSYFSQRTTLNDRYFELSKIKNENMSLVHEIERMQFDTSYQKRIVRDNLGFIAQDEFLVLFPKD